ncbi:MAG: DEAD/DEAH box helicase, partial [Sulfurimonas sp.]|nr:DEAD/DEAH box helicase [Sulfurimonas sp.]
SQNSIKQVSKVFNEDVMVDNAIATTPRNAVKLLDTLAEMGFISIDENDASEIILTKEAYAARAKELETLDIKGCDNQKLGEYFDSFFKTTSRIKTKERSVSKDKGKIKINQENFAKFKALWDILNHDAVVKYDIDSEILVQKAKEKINQNFIISGQDIIIKRDSNIEDKTKHDSQSDTVFIETHSIFTLYEFIKALSNNTKLSMQTVARVLGAIDEEKFALIPKNENVALKKIKEQLISAIYETIINKISYDIKEIRTSNIKDTINVGSLGRETYKITKKTIREKSIYDEDFMEVDSELEKTTIDESDDNRITVFGKLPRVNIPTAHGRNYNPDFGYVIEANDKKELYFVVEAKGYDTFEEISDSEKLKIKSAEAFFAALQNKGLNVKYETKLNTPTLSRLISDILKEQ